MTSRQKQPNVIVFFTDQQRWDSTGVHGNPLDLTPNFDRMARAGTDVHYAFTCQPVCGPARSCLQTGMYATRTGVTRNSGTIDPDLPMLGHLFGNAGYDTAYIGKWHLGSQDPVPVQERGGYESWLAANLLEFTSDAYDTVMFDDQGDAVKLPGYRVDAQVDAMIRYIDAHQQAPFFLFSSFIEPHHQNHEDDYPPPVGYRQRYSAQQIPPDLAALGGSTHQHLGGYYGMIKRLDEALGRLMDALRSLGMLENTIVLYTTDHGCHFKTRNDEYKRSCHESSIRLPTAICGPGFNGGGRINELVSLIDVPPTLLDAAGIPIPQHMQGRSILPLVKRTADEWPDDIFVQISESQIGRALRTKRWKYSVSVPESHQKPAAVSETYTEEVLYDLRSDPHELDNLIGIESFQEVTAQLRARLLARMAAAGEETPTIVPAPVRAAGQRVPDLSAYRDAHLARWRDG